MYTSYSTDTIQKAIESNSTRCLLTEMKQQLNENGEFAFHVGDACPNKYRVDAGGKGILIDSIDELTPYHVKRLFEQMFERKQHGLRGWMNGEEVMIEPYKTYQSFEVAEFHADENGVGVWDNDYNEYLTPITW